MTDRDRYRDRDGSSGPSEPLVVIERIIESLRQGVFILSLKVFVLTIAVLIAQPLLFLVPLVPDVVVGAATVGLLGVLWIGYVILSLKMSYPLEAIENAICQVFDQYEYEYEAETKTEIDTEEV